MNKCFKCNRGTDKNSVPTKVGDLVYISGEHFVYLHKEDKDGQRVWHEIEKVSFN